MLNNSVTRAIVIHIGSERVLYFLVVLSFLVQVHLRGLSGINKSPLNLAFVWQN